LPSLLTLAVLHYGGQGIATLPRFVYVAYPGVFILVAVALDHLASIEWSRPGFGKMPIIVAGLALGTLILLNNLDVFGYPIFYYHFYHSNPMGFAGP